jgi:hypothetical protein
MLKRTCILPRFAPIKLQPLRDLLFRVLSILDSMLIKTPLALVSRDICVVARKPRGKSRVG